MKLVDKYKRTFPYLRLSITEVCNFRCSYCLPDGYRKQGENNFLAQEEIFRLVTAFSELGVWKIRLTGGEPSLRPDLTEIIRKISAIPGIDEIALTTNGYKMFERLEGWMSAGLTALNVSLDSLSARNFSKITGHNKLNEILKAIDHAQQLGLQNIKLNCVLLKGMNDQDIGKFLEFVRSKPITVRFIELMRTGDNHAYFEKHHLSAADIKAQLLKAGWLEMVKATGAGPAVNFCHSDYQGKIGLIAPYSKDFCKGCNRLRVTATGDLRLCLFGDFGIALRPFLQSDDQKEELKAVIQKQLAYKLSSHFLESGETGLINNLSNTGG